MIENVKALQIMVGFLTLFAIAGVVLAVVLYRMRKLERKELAAQAEAAMAQHFYQLRAHGRGLSVRETVFRADDRLYRSSEDAMAHEAEFREDVTALRTGRLDGIHPAQCEIYAEKVTIGEAKIAS